MSYRLVLPFADVGDGITPADGAKLYVFEPGTVTPKDSYSDFALTTPNSNPVVADSEGVFSDIFLDSQADIRLDDKNDVPIWGPDRIYPPSDSISVQDTAAALWPQTTEEAAASITPTDYTYSPGDVRRYGAASDLVTDDTVAVKAAMDSGHKVVMGNNVIDSVDLSANTYATIDVSLIGNLKVAGSATGDTFIVGNASRESFVFHGNGYTIDCNSSGQTNPHTISLFRTDDADVFTLRDCKIENVCNHAIECQQSDHKLHHVENVQFETGTLHTGTLNEGSNFIGLFGGEMTVIAGCRFVETVAPIGSANRNTGGIFISGSNGDKRVHVRDCYFENLGHNVAGNLESPLDIYSYAKEVLVDNCHFVDSRFNPLRITNCGTATVRNCHFDQTVDIINDGGGDYADAACFTGGIVGRSATVNDQDNLAYLFENNSIVVGDNNIRGVMFGNDSSTYIVHTCKVHHCYIKIGTNSALGIFCNIIKNVIVTDTIMDGYNRGITVQQTDIAPLTGENCNLLVKDCSIENSDIGLFIRTSVSDLRTTIKDCNFKEGTPSLEFTVRDSGELFITGCVFPAVGNGDVSNLSNFVFRENTINHASEPVGVASCTEWDVGGNYGRGDPTGTFTAADATPAVTGYKIWKTADTTTYTDFDGPTGDGYSFKLLANHAATVTDGANISTSTGANKTLTVGVLYEFTLISDVWYETATA